MELNNITNTGTWGQQATRLNDNFNKVALGIDTLQEMYQSLSQNAIEVVATLPQTGKANKIYRLVGTTSYSDYMYNADDLTTPILMATYDNAIDNVPTAESDNLVKSGGVASTLSKTFKLLLQKYYGYYVGNFSTGVIGPSTANANAYLVEVLPNTTYYLSDLSALKYGQSSVQCYSGSPQNWSTTNLGRAYLGSDVNSRVFTTLANTKYILITVDPSVSDNPIEITKIIGTSEIEQYSKELPQSGAVYSFVKGIEGQLSTRITSIEKGNVESLYSIPLLKSYYINSNGELASAASANYQCTEQFIPVYPEFTYKTSIISASNFYSAYYDKDQQFISTFQGDTFTPPANARYVRLSQYRDTQPSTGTLTKQYNHVEEHENDIKITLNVLLTSRRFIDGYGTLQSAANDNYKCTVDFIPIVPNCTIDAKRIAPSPYVYHCVYDENKNLIASFQNQILFDLPANARYIRLGYYYNANNIDIDIYVKDSWREAWRNAVYYPSNKLLVCWGDSLTQGAGMDRMHNLDTVKSFLNTKGLTLSESVIGTSYPSCLQTWLNNYIVKNFGSGGESIKEIACREGANACYFNEDVVIPASGYLTFARTVLKYSLDDSSVNFTWQNPGIYNPCYINGVQCNIEKVDANNYKIRQVNGSGALNVARGTILTSPGNRFRHPDCAIFWCYTNGGYSSASDLIEKIDAMIHHMNPKKFIVVGTYAWNASQVSNVQSIAKALQQHYGDNFFDTELYFTKYALTEVGITPTTDSDFTQEQLNNGALSDTYCIANGIIPSSFWRFCYGVDSAIQNDQHLNAAGYAALAYKLYQIIIR